MRLPGSLRYLTGVQCGVNSIVNPFLEYHIKPDYYLGTDDCLRTAPSHVPH